MRVAVVGLAAGCVVLGLAPGLLFGSLVGLAPWADDTPTTVGLELPGTGSLPTGGIALVLGAVVVALVALRGRRVAAPAPTWACGQRVERSLDWTSAGFTKPLRLVLENVLRPEREIVVRAEGGIVQEVTYEGRVPHLFEDRSVPARHGPGDVGRPPRTTDAERTARNVRRLPDRARARRPRRREAGGDRVSGQAAAATVAQVVGGVALAPLLPGLVQHWKARLQGRRGPSPLQPYRDLRRLWGKSAVDVEGAGFVYRFAPAVAAASARRGRAAWCQ